ncbi:CWF19-like protein 2 [Dendrobium catenatum]|uniref:CWF19-like protein 2 n=1 Tax=Dendrobium catenatum TaxID=906689 RepID=UPI0009F50353|nr:CWF19-like protein 2 [Dendrobium catenatum]XP_020682417.1 CWF19-like protein 2 [Dendrobium catenatum]
MMNRKQEKHRRDTSDESSERDERRARKCSKKMRSGSWSWSCSDADSNSSERVTSSYSGKGDKTSKCQDNSSRHERDGRKKRDRVGKNNGNQSGTVDEKKGLDGDIYYMIDRNNGILRKEMGLQWMLRAGNSLHGNPVPTKIEQDELLVDELPKRMLTQKVRCQFCYENQSRPKHLVISMGNVTYMTLPPWEPILQGHCCILPLQHESATRTINTNVWEEIRNFKKCLLKMFSRQDKDVIFLETVIGLSRQRRHCLIECIPIPSQIAKQAPLYFKKAIDEAEDEWGQHDMKKVIPTSGNLRNVIPENFSYFHVEFGLDRGFVHVIDDDSNLPSSFGLNVIRGMLHLPVETIHHHHRREPAEKQKQAVATFVQEWEPFDWTRELD